MYRKPEAIIGLGFIVLALSLWLLYSRAEFQIIAYVNRGPIVERDLQRYMEKAGVAKPDRKKITFRYKYLTEYLNERVLQMEAQRLHLADPNALFQPFKTISKNHIPADVRTDLAESEYLRQWEFQARQKYLGELRQRALAVVHPRFFEVY